MKYIFNLLFLGFIIQFSAHSQSVVTISDFLSRVDQARTKNSVEVSMSLFKDIDNAYEKVSGEVHRVDASMNSLRNSASSVPSGSDAGTVAAKGSANSSGPKDFECKIYCKSAAGPVVFHRVQASSRKEAAKFAGDYANQICAKEGKSHASSVSFSESQCVAK